MNVFKDYDNSSRRGMSFGIPKTFWECRASKELSQKVLEREDLR